MPGANLEFFLSGGGGVAELEAVLFMFDFKNHVISTG
jgi:hypothetical protein